MALNTNAAEAEALVAEAYDTHEAVGRMEARGMDSPVAAAMVAEYAFIIRFYLPKKADINDLRSDLKNLGNRIDALDTGLNVKIDAVDTGLNVKIDAVDTGLNVKIDAVDTGLRSEIKALDTKVENGFEKLRLERKADHERLDAKIEKSTSFILKWVTTPIVVLMTAQITAQIAVFFGILHYFG